MTAMQGSFPGCPFISWEVSLQTYVHWEDWWWTILQLKSKWEDYIVFFTVLKSNWKTLIESFWRAKCLLCRTTLHFPRLSSCCGQIRIVVLTNWWITPADMDESQGKAPTFILCFWCNSGAAKPWHDNDRGCIASVPFCIKRCVLASRLDICQK